MSKKMYNRIYDYLHLIYEQREEAVEIIKDQIESHEIITTPKMIADLETAKNRLNEVSQAMTFLIQKHKI